MGDIELLSNLGVLAAISAVAFGGWLFSKVKRLIFVGCVAAGFAGVILWRLVL